MVRVLGSDPGFANLGLAAIEFDQDISDSKIIYTDLIRTEPAKKQARIRKMDDTQQRHAKLYEGFTEALRCVGLQDLALVSLESVSFVRNASTMCQIGAAWFGIYYLLMERRIYTTSYTPQEMKVIATGKKTATKEQMIAAVDERWPDQVDWSRWPRGKWEHVADAVVAAWAAIVDRQVPWSVLTQVRKKRGKR